MFIDKNWKVSEKNYEQLFLHVFRTIFFFFLSKFYTLVKHLNSKNV